MMTLPALVRGAVAEHGERPAVLLKEGRDLQSIGYAEFGRRIDRLATGLLAAGVEPGENVVLLSENRPEWVLADCAILAVGAVSVPLYPSLPAEQIAPLISRVAARRVIVEDAGQLAKLDARREQLGCVERIWVIAGDVPADHPLARPVAELEAEGEAQMADLAAALARREAAIEPEQVATIIFTSGTTGVPKGAMLTHRNLTHNVEIAQELIGLDVGERFVTFLPQSHVFQRMVTFLGISRGGVTLYNESLRALLGNLNLVRPTVLIVVPRFLELMRSRVLDGIQQKTGLAGIIARWAMEVAEQVGRAYAAGRPLGGWLALQRRLAEGKVCAVIREQLGLAELKFMIAGGAALPPEVGQWFYGLGVTIAQGYGLTETSPVVAVNNPHERVYFDTVGPPARDVEIRLADDGELLVRGPMIMAGYYEMPAETAEVIDPEGWFHTGDIVELTDFGHLKITDRKKNIMVLANGKNVAPAPIENRLLESPLIDQIVLVGDNQNVVTALIVPAFDALRRALVEGGEAADEPAAMVAGKLAQKLVRAEIARLSGDLAPFEMVRKFTLLAEPFTLERGELTPTLKLRRKAILEHYAEAVRQMAE